MEAATAVPTPTAKSPKVRKQTALATREPTSVARVDTSPEAVLQLAISQGAPLEQLEKFMALRERHEANEAKKAFNRAFAAFKAESVTILKGTEIKDGPLKGKHHADLHDVISATTEPLAKHGLTISWKTTKDDKDWMEVTCFLKHDAGHAETESMGGAPDSGPGRNAIQARGSTRTYLQRYTALAILGQAAKGADDDGGGGDKKKGTADKTVAGQRSGEKEPYTDEQFKKNLPEWKALVKDQKTTPASILAKLDSKFLLLDSQRKAIRELS